MLRKVICFSCIICLAFVSSVCAFEGFGVTIPPSSIIKGEKFLPEIFEYLKEANVKWVRLAFRWYEIEPEKGRYAFEKYDRLVNLAVKYDMKVLGVVTRTPEWASIEGNTTSPPKDLQDWSVFVKTLAGHYKENVRYWEIWIEPDIKKFWTGTPEEYVDLLKTAYKTVKKVDSSIYVLSAGLDGSPLMYEYFDKLLGLKMADYCDIVTDHPFEKTPPKSLERVKRILGLMKKHKVEKPLWLTAIGWQTGNLIKGPRAKDEETKARFLKESFELLNPYSDAIFWYSGVEGKTMFGIIEMGKDGKLRLTPAYDAYKEMATERGK